MSLTRAKLRDRISDSTGLPRSVVAQVLDALEHEARLELLAQGEVHFRGLFRVRAVRKTIKTPGKEAAEGIVLYVRPVRAFKRALRAVLPG